MEIYFGKPAENNVSDEITEAIMRNVIRNIREVIKNYDCKKVVCTEKGMLFAEFSKEFASDCGIAVCGEYNEEGDFHIEYYFPYLSGSAISSTEDVIIERRADNEAYRIRDGAHSSSDSHGGGRHQRRRIFGQCR